MAVYRRVYDSRRLQADCQERNRDQLRNPTLGSRVWASFFATSVTYTARSCVRGVVADASVDRRREPAQVPGARRSAVSRHHQRPVPGRESTARGTHAVPRGRREDLSPEQPAERAVLHRETRSDVRNDARQTRVRIRLIASHFVGNKNNWAET